ncbi:hypothetical protein [Treponema phagedenis]|uniref:Uncharacterized protein n=1 Tax=Treponema phagedenis TaxID=162 RepID=A0AAE6ISF3_TREPH|nr:hypothetical protein [Treponema phagedenis]QEJ97371.1 hypothetical protein FUT82_04750 [Treponema phagedenis]QEK03670.1 hypothetical protein FUT83_07540 [Treponema phagedenis]QEK09287.1 hypothetical protein FUT81_07450 [Treponema phagedenis]
MRQGYLREGLWQNVYLIEFYVDNNTSPSESFAFGVPPESEEFVLTQRKTETKTFGGLVIDDYGHDALKITLSGSTVNNELRRMYHTTGSSEYVTGEEEIFRLKTLLEKYKGNINTLGKKILLYDLSKHTNRSRRKKTIDSFCWQVYPGEFKIKRTKEKPNVYTYSIEFTAIPAKDTFVFYNTIFGVDFNKAFDAIEQYLQKLEKSLSFFKSVLEKINEARRFAAACKEVALYAISGTINAFRILLDDTFQLGHSAIALYRETVGAEGIPALIFETGDFVAAMLIDFMTNINVLANNIHAMSKKEFYIPAGVFEDWEVTIEELDALSQLQCSGIYNELCALSVSAQMERPKEYTLPVARGAAITTYGMQIGLITDGMSFESIAQNHYGDSSKAYIIASANSAGSIDDLSARGQKNVLIPVLERSASNYQNRIIGLSGQRDNYGVDIALDENGNILLNDLQTDFKFVTGRRNISQAVLMRLRENINKRVMLQLYGIKTTIPDSESAGSAYILSSIIQTLKQESRIKELLSVSFKGDGDALRIDIEYTDIGGQRRSLSELI